MGKAKQSESKVVYRGPSDPGDPTNEFEVPAEGDRPRVVLPLDAVVAVDPELASALVAGEDRFAGHQFEKAPAGAEPTPRTDGGGGPGGADVVAGNPEGTGAATPAGQ